MDYQKLERLYFEYKSECISSEYCPESVEYAKIKFNKFIIETMRSYMKDILDSEVELPISTKNRYKDFVSTRFNEYIDEYVNINKNYRLGRDTFCCKEFIEIIKSDFISFLNMKLKQSISPTLLNRLSKYYPDCDMYKFLFSVEKYIKGLE